LLKVTSKTKHGVVIGLTAAVSAPIANEPEEGVWIAKVIHRANLPDLAHRWWHPIFLAPTVVAAKQRATKIGPKSAFCVDRPRSPVLPFGKRGFTQVSNERPLTSATRAQQVHEPQPLDLACRICSYRGLCADRPIGNRSREHSIYAWYRSPCGCGLHRALRNHHGNRIGDLHRIQR
jgi:hypothetical protein